MKTFVHLRTALALIALVPAALSAEPAAVDPTAIGEAATLAVTPALRSHLVIVGRVSSGVYQAGVLVSKDGHILAAIAQPLDPDKKTPYLVILADGRRIEPEVVRESPEHGMVLLKIPDVPADLVPAAIATPGDAKWFLTSDWSPSPGPATLPRTHLVREIRRLPGAGGRFLLDLSSSVPGSPVFDLAGRLVAFCRKPTENRFLCAASPMADAIKDWPGMPALTTGNPPPALPELEVTANDKQGVTFREKQASPALAGPLPAVAVLQGDRMVALGTILSSDGLILTKASELGAAPSCVVNSRSWPAALLAVDEETDLALLRIDATNLPAVQWHDRVPAAGAWLVSPFPSAKLGAPESSMIGLLSHRTAIPRTHVSLDQPELTTSLGIALEQGNAQLVVAAVLGAPQADGLQRGDQLTAIDRKEISTRASLLAELSARRAGQRVEVAILREGKALTLPVTLAPAIPRQTPAKTAVALVSAIPSLRRAGFPDVLCHDGIVDSLHCGGPVADSHGRFVGINIARLDSGATCALTAPAIQAACKRLLTQPATF